MRLISKILLGTAAAASVATAGVAFAAPGQDGPGKARPDVTRAQAQEQAGKMFDRLDFNKDGKLDASDRQASRDARQKERFDRLDANKDGSLTRDEFNTRPDRTRDGQKAEGKRGDGEHFGRHHRGGGRHHGGHGGWGGRGMGGMKADQAPVTKAEFIANRLARFDAADADKNGTVTSAEHKAQRDKMRAEWQAKRATQTQQKAQ